MSGEGLDHVRFASVAALGDVVQGLPSSSRVPSLSRMLTASCSSPGTGDGTARTSRPQRARPIQAAIESTFSTSHRAGRLSVDGRGFGIGTAGLGDTVATVARETVVCSSLIFQGLFTDLTNITWLHCVFGTWPCSPYRRLGTSGPPLEPPHFTPHPVRHELGSGPRTLGVTTLGGCARLRSLPGSPRPGFLKEK